MTHLNPHELLQSQDTWKRSQIRLPPSLYHGIMNYAEERNLSLNTALIELADKGLLADNKSPSPANIKIYHLENGIKRVIFGKLVNSFQINYKNPNLAEIRDDIEQCLDILAHTGSLKERFMFLNKNVIVYEGNNHIDVVDDGKGSLGWLIIEDHLTKEYI